VHQGPRKGAVPGAIQSGVPITLSDLRDSAPWPENCSLTPKSAEVVQSKGLADRNRTFEGSLTDLNMRLVAQKNVGRFHISVNYIS